MNREQLNQFSLYSDFNCPFCYALHERLHELGLMDRIKWRGVQHAPYLPLQMFAWEGRQKAELEYEVAAVHRLAPHLPILLPPGKPNTRAAIELAAGMLLHSYSSGMSLVRELYRVFWWHGRDLSDGSVLDPLLVQLGAGRSDMFNVQTKSREIREKWESA